MLRSIEAAFARIDGAIEGFTAFYNLNYAETLNSRLDQRVHVRTLFQAAVHSVFLHVVLQLHHAAGQNARVRVAQDSALFEGGRIATVIQLAMELSGKTEEMGKIRNPSSSPFQRTSHEMPGKEPPTYL